jgi:hypothetical protein
MTTPKPDHNAAKMNAYMRAQRTIPSFEMGSSTAAELNAAIRRAIGRPVEETKEEEPTHE